MEYHGQFQNQDSERRTLTATMVRLQKMGNYTVTKAVDRFDLGPYQQKDINLLTVPVNNQSAAGAPTPAMVGATIRFTCTFSAK